MNAGVVVLGIWQELLAVSGLRTPIHAPGRLVDFECAQQMRAMVAEEAKIEEQRR